MTSVRDLLDVAAAELDTLSCRISLGEGPRAQQMADGWSLLLPAAQHLIRQTVGPYGRVPSTDRARARLPSGASRRSALWSPPVPLYALRAPWVLQATYSQRAVRYRDAAERLSLLDEATRLVTASAEVTLHGIGADFEHSATISSAAEVGAVARRLQAALGGRHAEATTLTQLSVPSPALPMSHPLGPLAQAVHEWTHLAVRVVDGPGLSSHDLRGVALVAGHLTAAARFLLAMGPPDATAPTDAALHRTGQAWSEAARQWSRFVLPGESDRALATTSWRVVTLLSQDLPTRMRSVGDHVVSPAAAAALRRSILRSVCDVANAHTDAVLRAARNGGLAVHARSLGTTDLLTSPRTRWLPVPLDELPPVEVAYARLADAVMALRPRPDVTLGGVSRTRTRDRRIRSR